MTNPRPMRDAVSRLTDKEYRFIRKEFGITKKELLHLSEDLLIELYDELSSIEATLSAAKGRASIRGHTAAGIAALLGEALRIHNENDGDGSLRCIAASHCRCGRHHSRIDCNRFCCA